MNLWVSLYFASMATAYFLEKWLMGSGRRKEGFALLGGLILLVCAPLVLGGPRLSAGPFILSFVLALGPGLCGLVGALMGLHPDEGNSRRNSSQGGRQ
jgi:hypothetical protein